jgi:hypothetical protein
MHSWTLALHSIKRKSSPISLTQRRIFCGQTGGSGRQRLQISCTLGLPSLGEGAGVLSVMS